MSTPKYVVAKPAETPNKQGDFNLFAQRLRQLYSGNGIVCQLAEKTNIDKREVSKAFVGKAIPKSLATKLAKALGKELNQLFIPVPQDVPKEKRSSPVYLRQLQNLQKATA